MGGTSIGLLVLVCRAFERESAVSWCSNSVVVPLPEVKEVTYMAKYPTSDPEYKEYLEVFKRFDGLEGIQFLSFHDWVTRLPTSWEGMLTETDYVQVSIHQIRARTLAPPMFHLPWIGDQAGPCEVFHGVATVQNAAVPFSLVIGYGVSWAELWTPGPKSTFDDIKGALERWLAVEPY